MVGAQDAFDSTLSSLSAWPRDLDRAGILGRGRSPEPRMAVTTPVRTCLTATVLTFATARHDRCRTLVVPHWGIVLIGPRERSCVDPPALPEQVP